MKQLAYFIFVLFSIMHLNAQVGVGTTNPNAILDITASNSSNPATTDGLLIPRVDSFPTSTPTAAQHSMLIYLTTTISTNTPGFYFWNQNSSSWEKLVTSTSMIEDHDFYQVGTTDAPANINDDIFTMGNMAIGKNNASFKIDAIENTNTRTANLSNSATASSVFRITGIYNTLTGNVTNNSSQRGIYNHLTGNGNNLKVGVYNDITGTGNSSNRHGTYNNLINNSETTDHGTFNNITSSSVSSNRGKIGTYNSINNTGTSDNYGVYNTLNGSSTRAQTGIFNWIINSTNAQQYGVRNLMGYGGSTGSQYGILNEFNSLSNAFQYGIRTLLSNDGNGGKTGVSNIISGDGNGNHTGTANSLSGLGTGNKIGFSAFINPSAGGSHVGILSSTLKSGGFSGFFIGNVSIGTEPLSSTTPNNYIFPASRGTSGQIMQTDATGNLAWVDLPNTNFWSKTGTELDVATVGDDIHFNSDQTSITFPASTATPAPMLYMFDGGSSNSDKMVIAHSSAFGGWGLEYEDVTDSFIFKAGATEIVEIDLLGGFPLRVYGTARATDFQSNTATYPDYVFETYYEGTSKINSNYRFKSLNQVEEFIKSNGHLPGVKTYDNIANNDMTISLAETAVTNLEKIEELFLHAIELQKENSDLKEELAKLEKRFLKLEKLIKQ